MRGNAHRIVATCIATARDALQHNSRNCVSGERAGILELGHCEDGGVWASRDIAHIPTTTVTGQFALGQADERDTETRPDGPC